MDWEGTLWTRQGPNPLVSLPTAIAYATGTATPSDMYAAGFARGSEFLWPYHQSTYWGLTQKAYRAEFDPAYDPDCPGATAGSTTEQILKPCPSDARYAYAHRPAAVHRAMGRVGLTGAIGRPLITLHGDLDTLLPIATDSAVYDTLVRSAGRGPLHRFSTIEGGNHVDGLYDTFPDRLRPLLPCYRSAFTALTGWVEHGTVPPPDRTVARDPASDLVNECTLG